jgi:hypothetical protein
VIAITASSYRECDLKWMKNIEHSAGYLTRIRELEALVADTEDLEMVAVLRRLVLAYREIAHSEVCGAGRIDVAEDTREVRPIGGPKESTEAQTQALTRG